MNKIRLLFLVCIFYANILSAFLLPDDIAIKIGSGYNSNFLRFSNYEMNSFLIGSQLGDSKTFDSPVLKFSFFIDKELDSMPIKFDLDLGFIDYTQSLNKTIFSSSFIASYKLGTYKWIKLGYKNIPKNYLKMYRDRDQIGSPLLSAFYGYERFFSSISSPIYKTIWFKARISRSSMFFNQFFTEFDLIQHQLFVKMYNLKYIFLNFSPYVIFANSHNLTYQSGLNSNRIDRSYFEYIFGSDFKIKNKTIFFNDIKTILSFKLREYKSSDLIDILHNNRSHLEFELIQEFNKKINDHIHMSMYCKYINRDTEALTEYVEDLKSFSNVEFGFEFYFNLTDKLYDATY